MAPTSDLRIDTSQDTFKEVLKRLSSPIDHIGVDLSALDARDTPLPSSTPASPQLRMGKTRSYYGLIGASKSTSLLQSLSLGDDAQRPQVPPKSSAARADNFPYARKAPGSTPNLGIIDKDLSSGVRTKNVSGVVPGHNSTPTTFSDERVVANSQPQGLNKLLLNQQYTLPSAPGTGAAATTTGFAALHVEASGVASGDKRKPRAHKKRLQQVLTRSRSLRADNQSMSASPKPSTPGRLVPDQSNGNGHMANYTASGLRSGAPESQRSLRDAIKSTYRNRSEDRGITESEEERQARQRTKKEKKVDKHKEQDKDSHPLGNGYKKHNQSTLFSDFKTTSANAASGVGKAGKASMGIFSKLMRSGSSNERVGPVPEEEYSLRILRLPLVEQTRQTRIAQSYDHCRDKTEFWMPALPWRCIDYLNGKCEDEGLYRISGGVSQVKEWRKRFDIERDINLLDETDLLDSSIIASLFKEWVRELPDDIFPKEIQHRIGASLINDEPGKSRPVPQSLRDELSNLPPFNYYLLFAITCHLSLLLSHEPKNKMSLDNLYRCFNQSLKLDGRIFCILVGEWRQCWQGCLTEDQFLADEYRHMNMELKKKPNTYTGEGHEIAVDDRAIASSSGESASHGRITPDVQRPATAHPHPVAAGQDTNEPLTPARNKHRSSSDVTGLSPMRFRN